MVTVGVIALAGYAAYKLVQTLCSYSSSSGVPGQLALPAPNPVQPAPVPAPIPAPVTAAQPMPVVQPPPANLPPPILIVPTVPPAPTPINTPAPPLPPPPLIAPPAPAFVIPPAPPLPPPFPTALDVTPAGKVRHTKRYRKTLAPPRYVISPVTSLQKVVRSLDITKIPAGVGRKNIETWKTYIETLRTDNDRLVQYALVYKELCRLIAMVKDVLPIAGTGAASMPSLTFNSLMPNLGELTLFIDMCFRDFNDQQGAGTVPTSATPFSAITTPVWPNTVTMPANYPLHYIPARMYKYDDTFEQGIVRTLNILPPNNGQPDPFDPAEFTATVFKTMCSFCTQPGAGSYYQPKNGS